ncbi:MAG: tyrosine-protein phosphatase [Fibrobacter sp.]|nr:tyrosine-protein phosphatase [Fibrobacter sp.]
MNKIWSIFAGLFFCTQVFIACGDTTSSAVIEIGGPTKTDTTAVEEPKAPDTSAVEGPVVPDTTTKPDTTAIEEPETVVPDTTAHQDTATVDTTPHYAVTEDSLGLHFMLGDKEITSSELYLNYPADSFLTRFEIGDMVMVAFVGYDTLEMAVAASTSDVPIAQFVLSAINGNDYMYMSVHNGKLAEILGISVENSPVEVIVSMKEKGGHLLGLDIMRNAHYMDTYPESYPELTIEEYANFREVRTTGIGKNKLYRSSSPIDHGLGRNYYADSLAQEAGVATFINLADSENSGTSYKGYETTYYSTQNIAFLALNVDFYSKSFQERLVIGYRYMIEHEGPYLVHCTYGMDRTGFTIAVLEALMGATAEEIQADYAKTFSNYFTVREGKQIALNEEQVGFFKAVVLRNLKSVYHAAGIEVPDTSNADWASATEKFLEKLGMTQEEIAALKERLK